MRDAAVPLSPLAKICLPLDSPVRQLNVFSKTDKKALRRKTVFRLKHTLIATLLLAVAMIVPSTANAGLIGTTVTLDYHFLSTTTVDTFTVTGGVDITCPGPYNVCSLLTAPVQTITVGDNTITYTFTGCCSSFSNATPNGFDFENLNLGMPVTGISLSTNLVGLNLSRVTFSANSVQLDMHGIQTPGPVDYFVVTLNPTATPEPSSLALFGSGVIGLLGVVRRKLRG
jgi:hypothetical protein